MPHFKPTGPISLQGSGKKKQVKEWPALGLRVVSRGSLQRGPHGAPALLHPDDLQLLFSPQAVTDSGAEAATTGPIGDETRAGGALDTEMEGTGDRSDAEGMEQAEQQPVEEATALTPSSSFLQLASGSDCVLTVRASPDVQRGCIILDEVQQFNLHLLAGDTHTFRRFVPPEDQPQQLLELEAEARLLSTSQQLAQAGPVQVDAGELASTLSRLYFGRMVAVNELLVVPLQALQVLVRVTAAHTLSEEEREEAIAYHCYRGLLTPATAVFLCARGQQTAPAHTSTPDTAIAGALGALRIASAAAAATNSSSGDGSGDGGVRAAALDVGDAGSSVAGGRVGLELLNVRSRVSRPPPTDVVHITTSDGEWFPVKKALLRPCVALTKAVRDSGDTAPSVSVDVDCLTFDRVLLFLEAHLLGRSPPQWSLHLIDDLAKAAEALQLRPLADYCASRLGQLAPRVKVHRYADVVTANAQGELWLILDSMVLDVKAWLPEHPGGATIIPRQSLNVDCARFFEMYHASRESFLYLRDFYIGEIHPDDRASVPQGGADKATGRAAEPPGPDFLHQLREYTEAFRLHLGPGGELLSASSVKGHLGLKS